MPMAQACLHRCVREESWVLNLQATPNQDPFLLCLLLFSRSLPATILYLLFSLSASLLSFFLSSPFFSFPLLSLLSILPLFLSPFSSPSFHPSSFPLSLSLSPPPIQFVATAAAARETSARGLEGLKRYWHDGVCGFGRQLAQVEANLLHAELREQDGVRPMQDHTATKILYTERYSKDSKEK